MNRIVLGIYDGPSGGAALVRDGRPLAIAEEDHLLRRPGVAGLPRASVQTVLGRSDVAGETVSAVVIATRSAAFAEGTEARPPLLYRMGMSVPAPPGVGRRIRNSFARARQRRLDEALRSEVGISCPIRFLDHHMAHALAAAALAGLPDCLCITQDAGADGAWAQVVAFEGGKPRTLHREPGRRSLLRLLDAACDALGIAPGLDRYDRLQALAARGTPRHTGALASALQGTPGRPRLSASLFRHGGVLTGLCASCRREDVAASALRFAGDVARDFAAHWLEAGGPGRLVLGGDLFDVASVVRSVRAGRGLERALVTSARGDEGLALGAAFGGCLETFLEPPFPFPDEPVTTPFLGMDYRDEDVERTLVQEGARFRHCPDIARRVARVLAEGRTVARFRGRAEIGRGGLGNRTVLKSPRTELRRLGFQLRATDFHLLVPEERFHDWFEADEVTPCALRLAPGMARPKARFLEEISGPPVGEWEGRVRVQTLGAEASPELAEILREFEAWTGVPMLAAAAFRHPDEPLVCSPRDALRTFRTLGADLAAIGPYLVSNPDPVRPAENASPAEAPAAPV